MKKSGVNHTYVYMYHLHVCIRKKDPIPEQENGTEMQVTQT